MGKKGMDEEILNESIWDKFKRLFDDIDKYIVKNPSWWIIIKITLDFLWEKLVYRNELIDYIQYRFYFKKRVERRRFITRGRLVKIIRQCNSPEARHVFDYKPLFHNKYKDLLGRDFLDAREASMEEVIAFLRLHKRVMGKKPDGMFGKGICEFVADNTNNDIKIAEDIMQKGLLLEEFLIQHEDLAKFNASSTNSLRVVTFITANGEVKIMAAVLRVGRAGRIADNFHHEGIAALVSIESGIVYTVGVDRSFNRYILHPDSKKQIVGFRVPKWQEIIEFVKMAAERQPDLRYVGWDLTICSDGRIVLIEGNPGADADVTQIPDQMGKWPLYQPLLEELKDIQRR
jgi:hypothetical protein